MKPVYGIKVIRAVKIFQWGITSQSKIEGIGYLNRNLWRFYRTRVKFYCTESQRDKRAGVSKWIVNFSKRQKITVGQKMTSTKCDSLGKTDKVWIIRKKKKMWRKSFLHAHVPLCTTVRDLPSPRAALAFFKAHSVGKPFPSLPQTGLSTCGHPSPPQASFINNT